MGTTFTAVIVGTWTLLVSSWFGDAYWALIGLLVLSWGGISLYQDVLVEIEKERRKQKSR